jgi:hypothetical protein
MSMKLRSPHVCLCLLSIFVPSCKDEPEDGAAIEHTVVAADVAELVCDAYQSCDCESGLAEASGCVDAVSPALAQGISAGVVLGLRYYAECLDSASAYVSELACRKDNEIAGDEQLAQLLYDAQRCKLLAGNADVGDPCTWAGDVGFLNLGDTCRAGLICADVCIEPPKAIGDLCVDFSVCPPQSACLDPNADGVRTCELPAGAGAKCNPHDFSGACDIDLTCDPMALECAAAPGAGDACPNGLCDSNSFCDGMLCQPYPGLGESCAMFGVCEVGATCDFDTMTCIVLPGSGAMCMFGQCATGFVCGPQDTCIDTPAVACQLPASVGFCLYQFDGLCDEPEGTGLCEEGTDPEDCLVQACSTQFDGVCDEPEGNGTCPEGSDADDCLGGEDTGGCPYTQDGECDEPEGTGICDEGTDVIDCA